MNQRKIRYTLWSLSGLLLIGLLATHLLVSKVTTVPNQKPLEGLQAFGTVPKFSLTERSGSALGLADLRGKVWIANFMFTTCQDTCPLQSAEMGKLQAELQDKLNLRLVSISIDPDHDTPAVLSRYAARFNADPQSWLFLTGDREKIFQLARDGFRLSAAPLEQKGSKANNGFIHSSRFVLVDGEAIIRGYYDTGDLEALKRLRKDLKILLEERSKS